MDLKAAILGNIIVQSRGKRRRHSIADIRYLITLYDIPEKPEEEDLDKTRRHSIGSDGKEHQAGRLRSESSALYPNKKKSAATLDIDAVLSLARKDNVKIGKNYRNFKEHKGRPRSGNSLLYPTQNEATVDLLVSANTENVTESYRNYKEDKIRGRSLEGTEDLKAAVSTYVLSYTDGSGKTCRTDGSADASPQRDSPSPMESSKELSDEELPYLTDMLRSAVICPKILLRPRRASMTDQETIDSVTSLTPIVESSRSSKLASTRTGTREGSPESSESKQKPGHFVKPVTLTDANMNNILGKILVSPGLTRRGSISDVLKLLPPPGSENSDAGGKRSISPLTLIATERVVTKNKEFGVPKKTKDSGKDTICPSGLLQPGQQRSSSPSFPMSLPVKGVTEDGPLDLRKVNQGNREMENLNVEDLSNLGEKMNSPVLMNKKESSGDNRRSFSPQSISPGPEIPESGWNESRATALQSESHVNVKKNKEALPMRILENPGLTRQGSIGDGLKTLSPSPVINHSPLSPLTTECNNRDDAVGRISTSDCGSMIQKTSEDKKVSTVPNPKSLLAIVQKHAKNHAQNMQRQRSNSISSANPRTGPIELIMRQVVKNFGLENDFKPETQFESETKTENSANLKPKNVQDSNQTQVRHNSNKSNNASMKIGESDKSPRLVFNSGPHGKCVTSIQRVPPLKAFQGIVASQTMICDNPYLLWPEQDDVPTDRERQRKTSAPLLQRNSSSPQRKCSVVVSRRSPVTLVIPNQKEEQEVKKNTVEHYKPRGLQVDSSTTFVPLSQEEADDYYKIKEEEKRKFAGKGAIANSTVTFGSSLTIYGGSSNAKRKLGTVSKQPLVIDDSLPTHVRFAALSEKYASLKARIGGNNTKQNTPETCSSKTVEEHNDCRNATENTLNDSKLWTTVESIPVFPLQEDVQKINGMSKHVASCETESNLIADNECTDSLIKNGLFKHDTDQKETASVLDDIFKSPPDSLETSRTVCSAGGSIGSKTTRDVADDDQVQYCSSSEIRENVMLMSDLKSPIPRKRTTVIAKLMDRKLGPRRKQSIVCQAAKRKSRVFRDHIPGICEIPASVSQFEQVRNRIEKSVLRSPVRQEALTIQALLNGLSSCLVESELVAICKECVKTLRTLDALGSLPSYVSLESVIINPSGTVKFKQLNSGIAIDDLFLAPEYVKQFPSEKTCVFSLATTLWSAADWRLTEAEKPSLSSRFKALLVSMTDDVPDARPNLDDVLQICDALHTEGDMRSRERCQSLLWEYQAAAAMEREDVSKRKTTQEEKKQHDTLMGSISVAASFKGFLKETVKPQERNPFVRPQMDQEEPLKEVEHGPSDTLTSVGEIQKPWKPFAVENSAKLKASSDVSSKEKGKDEGSNAVCDPNNNTSRPSPATIDRKRGHTLTEDQKEQLLSLLASAKLEKKAPTVLESNKTNITQSGTNNDALGNHSVKPPSPSLYLYPPYGQTDVPVMFSPITPGSLSVSPSVQSDISDTQRPFGLPNARFVPIAVPVPNMVSAPMAPFWYMPQGGVIPYPQPPMSPAQFVPITDSVPSKQSVQSTDKESIVNECFDLDLRDSGMNSVTPKLQGSEKPNILLAQTVERKANRSSTPQSIKGSKLPRPIWQAPISKVTTTPFTSQGTRNVFPQRKTSSEDVLERISKVNNVRARTPSPSLGGSTTKVFTIPRSRTPPVYWGKEETNKPITKGQRTRVSTGSLPSWKPSNPSNSPGCRRRSLTSSDSGSFGSSGSRPNSPVQRNRTCSGFSNRSSSPSGSRSSSPVSNLVSKFEQLSQESSESNSKPQSSSVSSLLSKFGSSSLVPEDRMVKGQLKPHVSASVPSNSSSKTGPLRSSTHIDSLQEALDPNRSASSPRNPIYSRRRSQTSGSIEDDKRSRTSSDSTRDVHRNKSETDLAVAETKTTQNSLSWESRRRLSSSLGNLFRHSDSVNVDKIANTTSMEEHVERARKRSPLKDRLMNSEEELNSRENPPIVPPLSDKTTFNEVSKTRNPNSPSRSSYSESLDYEEYGKERAADTSRRSKGESVSSSFPSIGNVSIQKDELIGKLHSMTRPDEPLSHLTPHRPSVKNYLSNIHQRNGNRQPGGQVGTPNTVKLSEWKTKAGVPQNLSRRRFLEWEPVRENRSAEPKPEKLWLPPESVISSQYSDIKNPRDLVWSVNSDSQKFEIPEDLVILESTPRGSVGGFDWSSVGFESFERERTFLTPANPLSPGSLKDLKPSSYFKNVTFKCGGMEPERDTNCPPKPTSFESMERDSSINITKQLGEEHKEQDYVNRLEREILLSAGDSEKETPPTVCSLTSLQYRGPRNSEETNSEDSVGKPNASSTRYPNPKPGPKNYSHPMETKSSLSKDSAKGSSSRGLSSNAARVSSSQDQPLTNPSRNDQIIRSRRPSGDISSTISGTNSEPKGPTLASPNPTSHASPKSSLRKYLSNPLPVDSTNATGSNLSKHKSLLSSGTNSSPHLSPSGSSSVETKTAPTILASSDSSGNKLQSDSKTSTRNQSTDSKMNSASGNPHETPSGSGNPLFKRNGGKTSPPCNPSERPFPIKAESESKKHTSGSTQRDTSVLYFKVTSNSSNSAAKTPNVDSNIRRYPYSCRASNPATCTPNNTSTAKPSKKPSSNPTSPLNSPQWKGNIAFIGSSNISNPNATSQSWGTISNPGNPIGKQYIVAPKSDLHKQGSKSLHHGSQENITSSFPGNSPQTSPLSSYSKDGSTNNPVVPTQTQLVDSSSAKNNPAVMDASYSPAVQESVTEDDTAPLRDKNRFPSSSSSDSGLNLSDSEDNRRQGKTLTQPEKLNRLWSPPNSPVSLSPSSETEPTSPKFPTGTSIFYNATEEQKPQLFSKLGQNSALEEGQFTVATELTNKGLSSDFSPKSSVLHFSRTSEVSEKSSETSDVDLDKVQCPSQSFSNKKERSTEMLHSKATISQQFGILSSKERLDASTPPPLLTGGASGKTIPMSARADSKELLGQLVKKVLTTAAAKQSSSPKASFAETSHAALKDSGKKKGSSAKVFFVPEVDENEKESEYHSKDVKSGHRSSDTDAVNKKETQETSRVKGSTPEHIKEKTPSGVSAPCPSASGTQPFQTGVNALTVEFSAPEEKTEPQEETDALSKVIDMIHDEFAFDGYLDDGVEDVNMAEYVLSLAGMSEENFKEAVADQYSDLYWEEDLLHDMFEAVTDGQQTRSPTQQFSESSVSDITPPGSVNLSREESSLSLEPPYLNSISRSSSERSGTGARDVLVSSLGEASEFLPIKVIAPEFQADIHGLLVPIYEDYHRVMGVRLASSVEDLLEKLGTKILEISQQLTLERRAKKKNMNSFNKMADVENKKDVKDLALKLVTEIEEIDKKIIYLKTVQRQLRNAYAERFGLDTSLLYAFLVSYSRTCVALEPELNNSFLNFSPVWNQRANVAAEILEESLIGPSLQSGSKFGLFSYLFDRHAMSQAYVRYFLYTYRYICTPTELFNFIREKCSASLRTDASGQVYNHQLQIRYRALDLLSEWIDCHYQFDFKLNPELVKDLLAFIKDELILVDRSERGHYLIELVSERQKEDLTETPVEPTDSVAVLQLEDPQGLSSIDSRKDSPRKQLGTRKAKSPVQCFRRSTPDKNTTYKPTLYLKALSVLDHSSRVLAEQLTLIQQDLFSHIHPVHFLNSRAHGIGVGRSQSPTRERDNMFGFSTGSRRISEMSGSEQGPLTWVQNMYVTKVNSDGCLENLLEHAQDVSLWVAVEICSASSVKGQLALITKFVNAARYCCEIRNYSTCVQIIDALEMFVVRQLPVWKQVPTKTTEALEELKAVKVLLKTDSTWLMKSDSAREKPTIPCVFLFVIHVQQQELGGFTLPNDMYKWTKMRSVARLVDQIRLFKQMRYAFQTDEELKTRLKQRIYECKNENLHALASENASNFHLSSSQGSRKFHDTFRKMKATLGGHS